jgi:hypothetical protein
MKEKDDTKRVEKVKDRRPYIEPTLEKREKLPQITASSPGGGAQP